MRQSTCLLALALALAGCGDNAATTADTGATASPPPASAPGAAAAAKPSTIFDGDDYQGEITRYDIVARDVVAAIDDGASAEDIDGRVVELTGIFDVLVPRFLEVRPDCGDYLKAAAELRLRWRDMTPDDIEAGYHDDKSLPPIQNGSACYHIKDLLVHPLTAQAILAADGSQREKAKREITEVLAHLSVVRALPR